MSTEARRRSTRHAHLLHPLPRVVCGPILDVGLGLAVVILVSSPALLSDEPFALDYTNSLWLGWVQGRAIGTGLVPSYFLHTAGPGIFNSPSTGIFNPVYAFYGGPAWSAFGGVDAILGGQPVAAFVGVTAVAIAAAYGGTLWLARQCGVQGLLTHVPALVFPTSAYYVTNLYGRGAVAEFMATSAIPLLIASAYYLLHASRWTPLPVLAFLSSLVIFTGSHNITLLWGLVVGVFTAALLAAIVRPRLPRLRRVVGVIGLSCLGLAVNAWYLLPDVLYASRTALGAGLTRQKLGYGYFNSPQVLFNPLRTVPAESSTPALYVQTPVWFLLWACAVGALILVRCPSRSLRRAWLGLAALITILVAVISSKSVWNVMPDPLTYVQFAYRLGTYVTLAVAGLVLVSSVALTCRGGRAARVLRIAAAGASVVSVGLCMWQLWVPTTEMGHPPLFYASRQQALLSVNALPSKSWYAGMSYADRSAHVYSVAADRVVTFESTRVHRDRYSELIAFPPGMEPVLTNIAGGAYLVKIQGLRWLGRNSEGFAVVQRTQPGQGPLHVVIETADMPRLGRSLSAAGLFGSLAVLLTLATRSSGWRRQNSLRMETQTRT